MNDGKQAFLRLVRMRIEVAGFSVGSPAGMTYTYRFNIGLHFQYMLDEEKLDNDFVLQLDDGLINPQYSKLWSNLPTNERRIRLEVVYLKL